MNARELEVKKGDPILPAWRKLQEWARSLKLIEGPGVRFRRTPSGTYVSAEIRRSSWLHPFLVNTIGDTAATVRAGTVNNLVPRIRGKRIDNLDEAGEETEPPEVKLTGPGDELRSYIALVVLPDLKNGELDASDPEAVVIMHLERLSDVAKGLGIQPLALVQWTPEGAVRGVFQIVHHNLRFQHVPETTKTLSRSFFWAV